MTPSRRNGANSSRDIPARWGSHALPRLGPVSNLTCIRALLRAVVFGETHGLKEGWTYPSAVHNRCSHVNSSLTEPESLSESLLSSSSSAVVLLKVRNTVALAHEGRSGEGTPAIAFALVYLKRRATPFRNVH